MNPQEPLFAKKMKFKITIVMIYLAHLNRVPVLSQHDSLLELQALNLGLFYSLSGSNLEAFQFDLEFLFPFLPSTYRAKELGEADFFFLSQIFMMHQQIISDFSFFILPISSLWKFLFILDE